eukprot:TRINITY_DN4068_c0_g1_i1.p1 TRINITY_DN4068_c0_g1~~TRINITY_DN4068_c0_g1_i1.p1  ORF type:complete len:311 (-),score=20.91 TRINITY_DN4068_c0_g1_i1:48-980(-)
MLTNNSHWIAVKFEGSEHLWTRHEPDFSQLEQSLFDPMPSNDSVELLNEQFDDATSAKSRGARRSAPELENDLAPPQKFAKTTGSTPKRIQQGKKASSVRSGRATPNAQTSEARHSPRTSALSASTHGQYTPNMYSTFVNHRNQGFMSETSFSPSGTGSSTTSFGGGGESFLSPDMRENYYRPSGEMVSPSTPSFRPMSHASRPAAESPRDLPLAFSTPHYVQQQQMRPYYGSAVVEPQYYSNQGTPGWTPPRPRPPFHDPYGIPSPFESPMYPMYSAPSAGPRSSYSPYTESVPPPSYHPNHFFPQRPW